MSFVKLFQKSGDSGDVCGRIFLDFFICLHRCRNFVRSDATRRGMQAKNDRILPLADPTSIKHALITHLFRVAFDCVI